MKASYLLVALVLCAALVVVSSTQGAQEPGAWFSSDVSAIPYKFTVVGIQPSGWGHLGTNAKTAKPLQPGNTLCEVVHDKFYLKLKVGIKGNTQNTNLLTLKLGINSDHCRSSTPIDLDLMTSGYTKLAEEIKKIMIPLETSTSTISADTICRQTILTKDFDAHILSLVESNKQTIATLSSAGKSLRRYVRNDGNRVLKYESESTSYSWLRGSAVSVKADASYVTVPTRLRQVLGDLCATTAEPAVADEVKPAGVEESKIQQLLEKHHIHRLKKSRHHRRSKAETEAEAESNDSLDVDVDDLDINFE